MSQARRTVDHDDPGSRRKGSTMSPQLREPVATDVPRAVYWRRRAVLVVALVATAFLLTGLIGRVGAEAELEDKVAGHAVVQPGETLWDVSVATTPAGVDPREHLGAIKELNGLDGAHVDAWSVVLIPAR
jgi:hypothetical protein